MTSNTLNILIDTDEETLLPCRVEYDYQSYMMRDDKVANLYWSLKGTTKTPYDIIEDQVKHAIRILHNNQVEFI